MDSPEKVDIEELKYPIGRLPGMGSPSPKDIENGIRTIDEFPTKIERAIFSLRTVDMQYRYRPQGWTISEVLQHCVDSHLNAFWRIKMALTEEEPKVPDYNESRWVEQADGQKISPTNALNL
ncbi:MAG: metal-dependent hydrolase, partial [Saprospiraceae bacterium]|nr:metal-dependent hydrolase [Saprospiraceae bacterium]